MTDLNSQLNYSSNLHYQQQQQLQSHLQNLQSNIKTGQDKIVGNNDPNQVLLNIPIDAQQQHQAQQAAAVQQVAQQQAVQQQQQAAHQQGQQQHHQPLHLLNNNYNNNGLFSDTLSPFFAPYGIDVSHFPLTNPPIFESALMNNNHGQPRRRISISNGQIGQITTHALNGEDLYDSQPPPMPKQTSQDDTNHNNLYSVNLDPVVPHVEQQQQQIPQQMINVPPPQPQSVPPPQQQIHQQPPPPQQQPSVIKQETPFPTHAGTGIPNHKLVYNNEVIFNPDAGPIPGTAAWKKARLLERNRIAASKCRQRKKAAHIQLKEDVEKYQSEINQLKKDKRDLFEFYTQVKSLVENNSGVNIDELTKLVQRVNVKEVHEEFEIKDDDDFNDDDDFGSDI